MRLPIGVIVSAAVTALVGAAAKKSGNKAQQAYDNHQAKKQQSQKK